MGSLILIQGLDFQNSTFKESLIFLLMRKGQASLADAACVDAAKGLADGRRGPQLFPGNAVPTRTWLFMGRGYRKQTWERP
jgi:hypothetical protein